MAAASFHIALVGNPNSGKSSLFNALTGLRQKVGNFPGVTVDKKTGHTRLDGGIHATIIDLPGTYSLYPKSADELLTCEVLLQLHPKDRPDAVVIIADASNLKRNLLFASQIMDLRLPVVIALTMMDIARSKGLAIDVGGLERTMGVPVVAINPRRGKGIAELKAALAQLAKAPQARHTDFIDLDAILQEPPTDEDLDVPVMPASDLLTSIQEISGAASPYAALQLACQYQDLQQLTAAQRIQIGALLGERHFQRSAVQAREVLARYDRIRGVMRDSVAEENPLRRAIFTERLDKTLLHPLWGNLILLGVLFLMFQSIFWLAEYPMGWIEQGFAQLSSRMGSVLPEGIIADLTINGIMAGLSGILMFVPQIMILFGFITVLEDSGYMARISFLTDRLMRSVGLNGRSVMPLISGMACAVPAVMAARTIQNKRERLITILVTPLMSCAARLPVYTILIALVVPNKSFWGIFNVQGLVLMGLYLLGFFGALLAAWVMSKVMKKDKRSFFLMELPVYRQPRWRNVGQTMLEKARIFVTDAGKVIMIISVILWVLSSYGPPGRMDRAEAQVAEQYPGLAPEDLSHEISSARLSNSFAGIAGHAIEPAIRPLGFDWKIGIALITSFAAREVFVGTMATLYSVGDEGDAEARTLREKMQLARRADGSKVYTIATGVSLMVFYVFAMQCMSTMAIVRRETRSWKWPLIQFAFMLAMAWIGSYIAFALLK